MSSASCATELAPEPASQAERVVVEQSPNPATAAEGARGIASTGVIPGYASPLEPRGIAPELEGLVLGLMADAEAPEEKGVVYPAFVVRAPLDHPPVGDQAVCIEYNLGGDVVATLPMPLGTGKWIRSDIAVDAPMDVLVRFFTSSSPACEDEVRAIFSADTASATGATWIADQPALTCATDTGTICGRYYLSATITGRRSMTGTGALPCPGDATFPVDVNGNQVPDECEGGDTCPEDPEKTAPGVCGCGVPDVDTDSDGAPDCEDGCPLWGGGEEPTSCGCAPEGSCCTCDLEIGSVDPEDGCPFGGVVITTGSSTEFVCHGAPGHDGAPGADGAAGADGPQGPPGEVGPQGPQGPPGPEGGAGESVTLASVEATPGCPHGALLVALSDDVHEVCHGAPGLDGPAGPQGPPGEDGLDGPAGPQGPPGEDGLDGPAGPQGPPGEDGLDGPAGPQGPPGEDGLDGLSVTLANEPAGANCPGGGTAVSANGITHYVCHGEDYDPTSLSALEARVFALEYLLYTRIVFVTSTSYDADLGGPDGADAKCSERAAAAGLPGTYKAWISASGTPASSRLAHSPYRYVRVDGVELAGDWADLTDGALDAWIDVDEFGDSVGLRYVWAATTTSGASEASTCGGWTSTTDIGKVGVTQYDLALLPQYWTQRGGLSCATESRLYCVQDL